MKRPLAYVTAAWYGGDSENAEQAARYCRAVYEAGFSPICPTLYLPLFLNDAIPEEHKSGIDMSRDLLRRSHVLVVCGHIIGSSGSGKTRFWLTPQLLQAHSSYVVVDPKGGVLGQVGYFLQKKRGYKIKVFNSIDFSKSMHYNPLAYIKNEADILKFVNALISNTKGEGKEGDPFWTKAETLLYCALIAYIIFEGPAEDRNMNTLVDMISGMEVKEDDDDFMNAVDYMFAGLEKRKPDCFAVKQYKKYKLSSGVVCSKRLLNQAVGKSLRTHNLKPKKGAQVMRKNEKITALYERLSRDDFGKDDDQQRESNSISNQKAMLEEFAARQGFTNIVHFTDDGIIRRTGRQGATLPWAAFQAKPLTVFFLNARTPEKCSSALTATPQEAKPVPDWHSPFPARSPSFALSRQGKTGTMFSVSKGTFPAANS